MTDTASPQRAPSKRGANDSGSMLFSIVFFGGMLAYYLFAYPVWSMIMIEPKLKEARAFELADQPEKALPIVVGLLRDNPRDKQLLYLAAGLNIELDKPILADFYLQALLKDGTLGRLSDEQDSHVEPLQLMESMNKVRGTEFRTEELDKVERLYYALPQGWQHINYLSSANTKLNEPASQDVDQAGYTPPDNPIICDEGKHACGFDFSTGNIWAAIAAQRLRIADPRGGPGCCSLSLDDPDLGSVDARFLDFVKAREAAGRPLSADSKEGANAALAFRSHVLLKQFYLLDFVEDARTSVPESNLNYYLFAGWVVITFIAFVIVSERSDKRKK